ncbi:MAG: WecB/TagA/CpsF family glycosyltransferase [Candidatus Thiodiazotropha weberae]|uniref:WecB/TagA/CpsF family glycosyltransferase n=1 Tax=Candidatus Thiodiazotropha endoloripes TaxID=1818881 RepID=UPI00083E1CA6|nr:WecB/TagA/CpsF family glycosyltransferase [Candidatus Thiodiazotropha endoloripes]MCG7899544.1 WecB/TagA/CpsF family glycosyltransferase [Candidatus Thiodiazotropha weberae]ODB89576.1 hypothetical protein A3194_10470 [Candidatus Thiodiazotropha endoloripes]
MNTTATSMRNVSILGMRVDETSIDEAAKVIINWAKINSSKYVCVSNVHMCMESYDSKCYRDQVNSADIVVPDGKPLAIGARLLGNEKTNQIRGADLTRYLLQIANDEGISVGFYGSSYETLEAIKKGLQNTYPKLKIATLISPPFRELTQEENTQDINLINSSGVQLLFVGLGCPKQEIWMSKQKNTVKSVMVGVGAVFDFLSGTKSEAPIIIQKLGLEWFFRLITEPRRLWKRYMYHNPRFLWNYFKQYRISRLNKV